MKKIILFCLMVLATLSKSQGIFNRAYHTQNEFPNPYVIEINGNYYYTTENLEANLFGLTSLYAISSTGTYISSQTLFYQSSPNIGFKSLDNKIILVGGKQNCDVYYPTQKNYLYKYNSNGVSIFQATYNVNAYRNPTASVESADSNYYVFTDSNMTKISKSGQVIFNINTGLGSISSALVLNNNSILLSASNAGVNSLVKISSTGSVQSSVASPVLFRQLAYYGNQKIIGVGTNNILYKFSSNFNLISLSNFTNGILVNKISSNNDSIYFIASSNTFSNTYAICDTSFNLLFSSGNNTSKINQTAILKTSNNKIAILSSGILHSTQSFFNVSVHYNSILNVMDKNGVNAYNHDLAILSVVLDSAYTFCNSPNICGANLRAKIKVKNVGIQNVTSFKIDCNEYPQVACGNFFYEQQFSNLKLAPGDSITITTNRFVTNYFNLSSAGVYKYCFYVSVPNDAADKTLQDNEFCFNWNTTGLSDGGINSSSIQLFPNPFDNSISIQSQNKIKSLVVINSLGQEIKSFSNPEHNFEISTLDLTKGIYFLKIETKEGLEMKKMMK